MMRATKKRCLMLGWMLAYVEQVDTSEFSPSESIRLLRSLTPLEQIERLPSYLRILREEGDRKLFAHFGREWLATASAHDDEAAPPTEEYRFWMERMVYLRKQLGERGVVVDDSYYIKVGLTGWDMARLQLLSRVAYDRGLISNRDMWNNQIFAWKVVASTLDSWSDLGFSCLLGYVLQADNVSWEKLYACYQIATESVDSPWIATRFK